MRAAAFQKYGLPLAVVNVPDPSPTSNEVVIQVSRCGICGSDLHLTQREDTHLQSGTILGHEVGGVVVDLGPLVQRELLHAHVAVFPGIGCGDCTQCLSRRDPVGCDSFQIRSGGYAEYLCARPDQLLILPSTISAADGALIEPLACGLHAVRQAGVSVTDRCFVLGAGPIGLAVIFWLRRFGVRNIAAAALSNRRESLARQFGATDFVLTDANLVEKAKLCLGGEPDLVFECVGAGGMFATAIELVRRRGKVVILGMSMELEEIRAAKLMTQEITVTGSLMYTRGEFELAAEAINGPDGPVALSMVSDVVSLADLPVSFEALKHRTTQCKVLVSPFDDGVFGHGRKT